MKETAVAVLKISLGCLIALAVYDKAVKPAITK